MSKVDDWFITPLEAHFEAQPTDGGRITILDDMDAYSTDQLEAAVEWLKRNRQSVKTFPSPKECLRAVGAVAAAPEAHRALSTQGQITAQNYAACAVASLGSRKEAPIIKKGSPQWDEWMEYFDWLGCKWILDLVYDRETWTVPSQFPGDFDRRFRPGKRWSAGDEAAA